MRKIKYLVYFLVSLFCLQGCSLLAPNAPEVDYQPFESIKDYKSYRMTELETMLSDIFKQQGLTGKIQVTDLSANFPQNSGFTADFVYTEIVADELVAQSSSIDVAPGFTELYDPEDLPEKVLSPSELEVSRLFSFLKYSAWDKTEVDKLLSQVETEFLVLESLGLQEISVSGSFASELSPAYYEQVAKYRASKDKAAFAGFYAVDVLAELKTGDTTISIGGLLETDTSGTFDEDEFLENLIFTVQDMDFSQFPDANYQFSYTLKEGSVYSNSIYSGFDFEVKSGQLVNFYVEPMGLHEPYPEEDRGIPTQETQAKIVHDFLSSYQSITSIEVIDATEIQDTGQQNVTVLTLKINEDFFIQYEYSDHGSYDSGSIVSQYGPHTLVYGSVNLDSPDFQQRLSETKITYLTAE